MSKVTKIAPSCIKNVTNNPDIFIINADKGGQIIVMDTSDYFTQTQKLIDGDSYKLCRMILLTQNSKWLNPLLSPLPLIFNGNRYSLFTFLHSMQDFMLGQ